jgi:hypothetical protein
MSRILPTDMPEYSEVEESSSDIGTSKKKQNRNRRARTLAFESNPYVKIEIYANTYDIYFGIGVI